MTLIEANVPTGIKILQHLDASEITRHQVSLHQHHIFIVPSNVFHYEDKNVGELQWEIGGYSRL